MSIEAMKLALEALEDCDESSSDMVLAAIDALHEAIAEAEQAQPVAFDDWYKNAIWGNEDFKAGCHRAWNAALKHTAPPPRQPLTDEEIMEVAKNPMTTPCSPWWLNDEVLVGDVRNAALVFARAIEAAHGIFANAQNKGKA